MLHHFNRTVSPSATVAYIGATQNTSNLATYTFSNASIGTASNDRIVVVGIGSVLVSSGSVSSVTIGGNAAQIWTQSTTSGNPTGETCIASLLVTSGTTATIEVTYSAGRGNCTIYVWTIKGAKSTAAKSVDSSLSLTSAATATLLGQVGAVGCAVTFTNTTGGSSFTWSGMTENADQTAETRRVSAASGALSAASNNVTATNSISNATVYISGAAWR